MGDAKKGAGGRPKGSVGAYAAQYGMTYRQVARIGLDELDAMTELGREITAIMARLEGRMRRDPWAKKVKAAVHRIGLENRARRRERREQAQREKIARLARKPVEMRIRGELVRMAPKAQMGAELLGLGEEKVLPCSEETTGSVYRMMQLARKAG